MNTIRYRDFLPQETPRSGIFGGVDFSGFDSCVAAMNDWLAENAVEVLRMETVTLPNIHSVEEQGSGDTELHASHHTLWYQFVRLWYTDSRG
ncbi:MAG: hypothetical protein R3228_13425 [Halioglobus sp.]|nr:hypothetical protein [Halioglobus sp.]